MYEIQSTTKEEICFSIHLGIQQWYCHCDKDPWYKVEQLLFLAKHANTRDQESLSAPFQDCLCQTGASSWSGGTIQTQDYCT